MEVTRLHSNFHLLIWPAGHLTLRSVATNSITVFEHETLPDDVVLSDPEKNAIERLNEELRTEVLRLGRRQIQATSFVGFVQLEKRAVQILPKIYRDEQHREQEATNNLLFFLHYTHRLDISETEIARLQEQKTPLSEVLYWVFARRLWTAVRQEILRGYVPIEETLGVLKGKWRLNAQCRSTAGWRKDVFEVCYDEFSENNLPNQLLKAAIERIYSWAHWTETRRYLTKLRAMYADVNDRLPTKDDFNAAEAWLVGHRRRAGAGRVYRPLLNMAKMFLLSSGTRLSAGKTESFAFIFDMNELFEQFIAEFVRRELRNIWEANGWFIRSQSATRALLLNAYGRDVFWLKPDLRFDSDSGATELIIDTKYKRLDPTSAKLGVAESDAYQMFAYARRYDCTRVVLLYPETGERIIGRWASELAGPTWLEARTVNLRRDFSKRAQRERLKKALSEIIKNQTT